MKRVCAVSVALASLLLSTWLPAQAAETFPSKPIKFIIGGKSGDAYDVIGRRFAPALADKYGVSVMPVDQLGPVSVNFFDSVNESAPDGYTLGFGGAAHRMYHVVKPGRLKYDVTSLPLVAAMNTCPDVVWASPASKTGIKTAKDLFAYKDPIKVNLFSPILVGVCSLGIVAKEKGLDLRPVVFESFSEGHVAMLRGDVDVGTTTVSGVPMKYIRAGQYYPLFIWGTKRWEELPDVPCSRELGLNPDLDGTIQQRIYIAPKGTPADRIARLAKGVQDMLSDPEMVKWGKEADQPLEYLTLDQFEKSQGTLLQYYMKNLEAIKPYIK